MDPTMIQFLLGVFGGTAAGLAASRRHGKHRSRNSSRKFSRPRKRVSPARAVRKTMVASTQPVLAVELTRPILPGHSGVTTVQSSVTSADIRPEFSACPSCGLDGPNAVLTEHFLSSPSHQYGPPASDLHAHGKVQPDQPMVSEEDRHSRVVRNLLSMLVPPRAFGRRHLDKMENPVADIIQKVGPSRRTIIQPLLLPPEK